MSLASLVAEGTESRGGHGKGCAIRRVGAKGASRDQRFTPLSSAPPPTSAD